MPYEVFARKYRPRTFADVIGQEHVARTLMNAIEEGRISQAYVFAGTRGVGKTSLARIFAKGLNCKKGPTSKPCLSCDSCESIANGTDADVIEIDAASHTGVDDVRVVRDDVRYAPLRSRFKVYIVDEAHMLSKSAWNAFLKTLEEPPPHVKFVFATTEPHRLPETIFSRCQRFDLHRISAADILARLKEMCSQEKIKAEERALAMVARAGRGSLRDAQSLLDQVVAYAGDKIELNHVELALGTVPLDLVFTLADAWRAQDVPSAMAVVEKVFDQGKDAGAFLDQVVEHVRNLMLLASCGAKSTLIDLIGPDLDRAAAQAQALPVDGWVSVLQLVAETRRRLRESTQPRVLVELLFVKLCRFGNLLSLADAVARLESGPGIPVVASPARPAAPAEPMPAFAAAPARTAPMPAPVASPRPAEPAPAAAASGGEGDWQRVLEAVKTRRPTLHAVLREGRLLKFDAKQCVVGFGKGFSFHRAQAEEPEHRKIVEEVLAEVLGKTVAFGIEKTSEEGPPRPFEEGAGGRPAAAANEGGAPPAIGGSVLEDPAIRKVMEIFKGRITGVTTGPRS